MMPLGYAKRVAIVTGAASGIGRALSLELVRRGASVHGFDRDANGLDETRSSVPGNGMFHPFVADVRDVDAWTHLTARVVDAHQQIDYLFNNAGWSSIGFDSDVSLGDWREVVDTNLLGTVYGMHAVYPHLLRQRSGCIVNIASMAGLLPLPGAASYVASKHAVVGLSHSVREELSPYGIQVNVVCPAAVDTNIHLNSKFVNVDRQRFMDARPGGSMSAAHCAELILRGVDRNQRTITPGSPAFIMSFAYRHFPWLVGRIATSFARTLELNREATLAALSARSQVDHRP